ncbi:MAG: hypothetical protein P8014_07910 [Acidihalobacter sp.]|uniref:hypothetical protein n=1 Tax=Acidihalobacter sp. TaxID=1872108 RepID=UPI00307E7376
MPFLEFGAEGLGAEQALERGLGVVEVAVYADDLQVGGVLGDHLQALHVGGAAVRVEAGDLDVGPVLEGLQRGGAGVAAGGGHDQVLLAALLRECREHDAEGLQGHVLEGARGAVVQLADVEVVAYLHHRHRVGRVVEAVVQRQRLVDQRRVDIQLEGGQYVAGQSLVVAFEVRAQELDIQSRQTLGHVDAAEGRHGAEDGLGEADLGRTLVVVAAGFDEVHCWTVGECAGSAIIAKRGCPDMDAAGAVCRLTETAFGNRAGLRRSDVGGLS